MQNSYILMRKKVKMLLGFQFLFGHYIFFNIRIRIVKFICRNVRSFFNLTKRANSSMRIDEIDLIVPILGNPPGAINNKQLAENSLHAQSLQFVIFMYAKFAIA